MWYPRLLLTASFSPMARSFSPPFSAVVGSGSRLLPALVQSLVIAGFLSSRSSSYFVIFSRPPSPAPLQSGDRNFPFPFPRSEIGVAWAFFYNFSFFHEVFALMLFSSSQDMFLSLINRSGFRPFSIASGRSPGTSPHRPLFPFLSRTPLLSSTFFLLPRLSH